MKKYDVVIMGAGMMGLAFALGLAQNDISVCLIDAKNFKANKGDNAYDLRLSAITPKTAELFIQLGVWETILATRAQIFNHMHVCNEKHVINFDAHAFGASALGWIIENTVIQTVLFDALQRYDNVSCLMPMQIEGLSTTENGVDIFCENKDLLKGKLLVAADGANSWVRNQLAVDIKTWSYEQSAIVANVRCENVHQQTAWQRFLSTGPLAFLPLAEENSCSIVWSCESNKAEDLQALNDAEFNLALTQASAMPLGHIELLSQRLSFPLVMRHIHHYVLPSVAFIGDAAHTIHPLAGQGANLGFADVKKLLDVILLAQSRQKAINNFHYLRKYERERKAEVSNMIMLMESFHRLFSNENRLLSCMRTQGLSLLNNVTPIKNKMMKYAMGV